LRTINEYGYIQEESMAKNINKTNFNEATLLKLSIFGECFEEWFPVFLHSQWYKKLYVFDFFAGSGTDIDNNPGSPLILLDRAKGEQRKYCSKCNKDVWFVFNEMIDEKFEELKQNADAFVQKCMESNNCSKCIFRYSVKNDDFRNIFSLEGVKDIFQSKEYGKFVLLDQYGFSQIDEKVFSQLVSFPKTDFIFFISSSFISRFREHPNTVKHIDTSKIAFENRKPNEIHRAVADYFRSLIPEGKEYYLHHFSIQKEMNKGNYYGLIFGSNHSLGMEKFLKVCWKHDPFSGEANYNIDNNYGKWTLFEQLGENVKKDTVKEKIKCLILSGEMADNVTGLKYAMRNGCEPNLFVETVVELEKAGKIERTGKVNNQAASIHKADQYEIKLKTNGA